MKISLILCLLSATVCFAELTVTVGDAAVSLGGEVMIPCNYETDSSEASAPKYKWFIEESDDPLVSTGNNKSANGMSLEANGALKIKEATWTIAEDFSRLECEVEIGRAGLNRSNTMTLQVIVLPKESEEITTSLSEGGQDGFDISDGGFPAILGECSSPPSLPAASITFYENGQILTSSISDDIADVLNSPVVSKAPDGHKLIATRNLMKSVDKSDHRAQFICNVKVEFNGVVYYEKNQSMPTVNVKYETDMAEWEEKPDAYLGETITLRCDANGFPEPTVTINGVEGAEQEITITSDMDGTTYQCSAQNYPGQEAAESSVYTINVLSAEEPTVSGEGYEDGRGVVEVGKSATFDCSGSGNPQPTVAWYDSKDAKISESGSLQFSDASLEQTGTYTCKSFVDGHEMLERSTTLQLEVEGIAINGDSEEDVSGKEGDNVLLDCAVNANPKPTFTWDFDDAESTETKTEQHTYTSQVTVGPLSSDLSEKVFTCTAENSQGSVTKKFILPEISTASGATTGIIIAILLIILVVAIVLAVLYNKGIICKKGEKGDESADGDIALEINKDENDVEAGNGKPAAPADEENEPAGNPEEEKLMGPDEVEK